MASGREPRARRRGSRRPWRRKLGGTAGLLLALLTVGGVYSLLVPRPQVATAQPDVGGLIARGRDLYVDSCISCHGSNLQGVPDRGPSLVGVGDAAIYFQVSSGRMPLARLQAQARRKDPLPEFDPTTPEGNQNLRALGAYVQANGGGPARPAASGAELVGSDPSKGGELFRDNCASCHNFTARGGALLSGKYAPRLEFASPEQMYTAMQSGPQAMPAFSDRQLTPEEKENIIAYILSVRGQQNSPGGLNLGEYGPTTEGLVALVVGLVALVGITLWLGARS
jgi:ubiquinol-cytochrome c reductase cytochrome c subunit